ncbi:hypothetical protein [Sporosarcina ureae]|uniref:hypothetical protein n=1 Tax=Sporosarcina ureae TaxID=1571 RepID=UPI000A17E2FB|nr:hypothetical protein [Sporosarcina ureae]ARK22462.1 hypothetical protein SporoP32a_13510 [Sporosarcina ureae]
MNNILLRIDKKPHREGEHLSYIAYEKIDEKLGGMSLYYCNKDIFGPGYSHKKLGSSTGIIMSEENENNIFFEILEIDLSEIKDSAMKAVSNSPDNYSEQYMYLIKRIQALGYKALQ